MNEEYIKDRFIELIEKTLEDNELTIREFGDELNCEAQSISPTTPWMWNKGPQVPGINTLRRLALYGKSDLARQFGRDGLAIYGLRLLDE